ncbi:MAG TPA: hypothetical protein VG406_00460 [Isosphaeraceae bacterium]|nr:hypothetical protein [Isosphaeraceae bacterium]
MLSDGVTRATRIAKLSPGTTIRVEVVRTLRVPLGHFPTIGATLPMNPSDRDELLHVLARFGEHAPDMRFGQLIANLAFLARAGGPSDIWDVEDAELLAAARSFLLDLERRSAALASAATS